MFTGSASAARELLLAEAAAVEPHDPARAVLILADAVGTLSMAARVYELRETAERLRALAMSLDGIPAQVSDI